MPCFWLRTIWDYVKVDSSAEADVAWVSVHDPMHQLLHHHAAPLGMQRRPIHILSDSLLADGK